MNDLAERLENVLSTLYDYEYIDLDKFYNDKSQTDLLENLDTVCQRGYVRREEMEMLQELYDELDGFIKFETNYNSEIGDF